MEKDNDLSFLDETDIAEFNNSKFNYERYINYNNEMIGLVERIVEEYQNLECSVKDLLKYAVEKGRYKWKMNFSLELASSRIIINTLTENGLIEGLVAEKINKLIDFRNYLIHKHYMEGKNLYWKWTLWC